MIRLKFATRVGLAALLALCGCERTNGTAETETSPLVALSQASQELAASVACTVVRIEAQPSGDVGKADDELAQLFGEIKEPASQGSGIVVSSDGLILTNYHVVRTSELAKVTLDKNRTVTGHVVGVDALTDLALVRVPVQGLTVGKWGDSDKLKPGEFVWVIGNPFGLQRSITFGILSARQGRGVTNSPFYDFLQTDAVVNPGNSGGPLVNSRGEIVGVTTRILGTAYQGVSFAIPSRTAREVLSQLRKQGKVSRGWLGITLAQVDDDRARQSGLSGRKGVYVLALANLADGISPAASAGIRPGDVILRWNGQDVQGVGSFARRVASSSIGSTVQLATIRNGQSLTVSIEVAEHP